MDIRRLQLVLCRKILHERETARNKVPIPSGFGVQALDRPDVVISLRNGQLSPRNFRSCYFLFFFVSILGAPVLDLPFLSYP